MLDLLFPIPGNVVDGTDLMHDIKFQSSLTDVKGTDALLLSCYIYIFEFLET